MRDCLCSRELHIRDTGMCSNANGRCVATWQGLHASQSYQVLFSESKMRKVVRDMLLRLNCFNKMFVCSSL